MHEGILPSHLIFFLRHMSQACTQSAQFLDKGAGHVLWQCAVSSDRLHRHGRPCHHGQIRSLEAAGKDRKRHCRRLAEEDSSWAGRGHRSHSRRASWWVGFEVAVGFALSLACGGLYCQMEQWLPWREEFWIRDLDWIGLAWVGWFNLGWFGKQICRLQISCGKREGSSAGLDETRVSKPCAGSAWPS